MDIWQEEKISSDLKDRFSKLGEVGSLFVATNDEESSTSLWAVRASSDPSQELRVPAGHRTEG
ncbi:MAG: hypothetical protein ACOY3K_00310 [Candidatus Omnitrophota bacterium]